MKDDDRITIAARNVDQRKSAVRTTVSLFRRRMDPRLIAADVAKLMLAKAITRVGNIRTTPKQRKRALIGAGVAAVATIGMRVMYRNAAEKRSLEDTDNAKRGG